MITKLLRWVKPFDNESLTNLIVRLAKVNYCPINWILSYDSKSISLPKMEYLNYLDKSSLYPISQLINLDIGEIEKLVMERYTKLWEVPYFDNFVYNYVYFKKRTKYCPFCLKEKFYHRLYWQLNHIVICIKHNVYLLDTCIKCGKEISPIEISNGECKCGAIFMDSPVSKVEKPLLIQNQIKMYDCYNIFPDMNIKNHEFYYGLNIKDYLELVRFLIHIIKTLKNEITIYDCMQGVEEILNDWPKNIKVTIDKYQKWRFERSYKRREIEIENYIVEKVDILRKISTQSIYEIYASNFFTEKLAGYLIDGKVINVEMLTTHFFIDRFWLKSLLGLERGSPVVFEEVIALIKDLIKNSQTKWPKETCVNICDLYYDLNKVGSISMVEILHIIKNKKVGYVIHPFKIGFRMIYVPKKKLYRYIKCNNLMGSYEAIHFNKN